MFPEGLVTTEAPADTGFDDSSVDTSVDTGTDTAEATEQTEAGFEPKGTPGEKPEGTPPANVRPILEGNKLSPEFRAIYDKLKAENPGMARAIISALQLETRFLKEVPGGLKEVQQLREHIERLGGEDGIQDITDELKGWNEFDKQYTTGDPKVLEFLTETPAASAAFLKIAPAAFEKFREVHPEGYGAYVSQVFLGDMQQARIPLLIERLGDMLPPDNPKALEIYQQLVNYVNRIGTMASKQVTAPVTKDPQDDKRAQELTQRETNLRQQEWKTETDRSHGRLYGSEWDKQIGARKLTTEQRESISELYGLRLKAILKESHPKFDEQMRRHFENGQKDGFTRLHSATYADAVPKALRAAIQRVLGNKPGPGAGTQQKTPAANGATPKPAAGFTFVGAKPDFNTQVNRNLTTPDMWIKRQAILKDGRKVTWK